MLVELELGKIRKAVFHQTRERTFLFDKWTNIIGDNATGKSAMLKMIGARDSYETIIYDGTYWLVDQGKQPIKYRLRFDKPTSIIWYNPKELLDGQELSNGWFWGSISAEDMIAIKMGGLCGAELQERYFSLFLKKHYDLLHNESIDKIMIFDEPENSLSLKMQEVVFNVWASYSAQPHIQVIMATHSPIAMTKGKCLELTPNYRKYYADKLLNLSMELAK